jgi:hypothetical protein
MNMIAWPRYYPHVLVPGWTFGSALVLEMYRSVVGIRELQGLSLEKSLGLATSGMIDACQKALHV